MVALSLAERLRHSGHEMTSRQRRNSVRTCGKALAAISLMWLWTMGSTGCGGSAVTDLGPLGGYSGYDINELGHAVGNTQNADSRRRAFVYDGDVLTDLGPADAVFSEAYGINDQGQVVGRVRHESNSPIVAFLCDPSEGMQDLGTLGGDYSIAVGINNSGQVVGWSDLAEDDEEDCEPDNILCGASHAFLWEDGTMTDLGTLGGSTSRAHAINEAGQIVGWAETEEGSMRAVLWQSGTVTDLGIGGLARGINDSGEIVGTFYSEGKGHAFLYREGEVTNLGISGWFETGAYGINNRGQVVGYYTPSIVTNTRAFLWEDGEFVDVDTLSSPLFGWQFYDARDINDTGQIVGTGSRPFGAGASAFILTLPPKE